MAQISRRIFFVVLAALLPGMASEAAGASKTTKPTPTPTPKKKTPSKPTPTPTTKKPTTSKSPSASATPSPTPSKITEGVGNRNQNVPTRGVGGGSGTLFLLTKTTETMYQ